VINTGASYLKKISEALLSQKAEKKEYEAPDDLKSYYAIPVYSRTGDNDSIYRDKRRSNYLSKSRGYHKGLKRCS